MGFYRGSQVILKQYADRGLGRLTLFLTLRRAFSNRFALAAVSSPAKRGVR